MIDTPWALLREDTDEVKRLKKELAVARRDRDTATGRLSSVTGQIEACRERDEWRECAEKLAPFVIPIPADMADHAGCAEALAEFERLMETTK
jgi:hypothetical protein